MSSGYGLQTIAQGGRRITIDVVEKRPGQQLWQLIRGGDLETFLNIRTTAPCFIFAKSTLLQDHDRITLDLRRRLQDFFGMPAEVWTNVHWESNGFFGCNDQDKLRHNTWFRFLVKQLMDHPNGDPFPQNYAYDWYKMGFFSTWKPSGYQSVLCLDCPDYLVNHVATAVNNATGDPYNFDPYWFHHIIICGIVNLYDASIWKIRDVVRDVEKSRPKVDRPNPEYDHLHEAARHVIHSTETLIVSTDIISKISRRQQELVKTHSSSYSSLDLNHNHILYTSQVHDHLEFYHGMIHAFKCRSEAMHYRHHNEISLAFNTVAQYHSRVASTDAAAMKVIAALTVVFLPATFLSAVFSMSFFNNGSDWGVSSKIWIYWAVAVPLTIVTGILLFMGNRLLKWLDIMP